MSREQLHLENVVTESVVDICKGLFCGLESMPLDQRVSIINDLRELLHELSPFKTEPVDFVKWVKNPDVHANDYNPNSVAPPEMELLHRSIQTDGAACFDLHAATVSGMTEVGSTVEDGHPLTCGTGLAFEVPQGHVMLVFSRSGHGFKNQVRLCNSVGVVDSDFRGEVMVQLISDANDEDLGHVPMFVNPLDRIAQAMIIPVQQWSINEVDDLAETERGTNGLGSTGQRADKETP